MKKKTCIVDNGEEREVELVSAFEPADVEYLNNEVAVALAHDLGKPIFGPVALKESLESKGKMANAFYIPLSEKEGDYAVLVVIDPELQMFLDLAKKYEVQVIPIPHVITFGEKK